MQTAKNIGSVVGAGMAGYGMGKEHGNMVLGAARGLDSHMNAANMSAIGGRPMSHDTLVQKYASNKTAAAMQNYYNRSLPRNMPGPKNAAFYSYRFNLPVARGDSVGTPGQMSLLRHVRRNQERVNAVRNAPAPRGTFHHADPAAVDLPRDVFDYIRSYASSDHQAQAASALAAR